VQWADIAFDDVPSPLVGRAPRSVWRNLVPLVVPVDEASTLLGIGCWEGWNGLEFGPSVQTVVWRGEPLGIVESDASAFSDSGLLPVPAITACWPTGVEWFAATGIDFDSTIVAGSMTLIDRLMRDAGLEVLAVDPATSLLHHRS